MTAPLPSRVAIAVVLALLVLASVAGPVGAETATVSAAQQSVTELDLRASLAGELVVVAGWFEVTATADGRLNTSAQETALDSTFDVDVADTFGAFEYRGQLVGIVNASRVLVTLKGNTSRFERSESAAPPATLSGTTRPLAAGTTEAIGPEEVDGSDGEMARHGTHAAAAATPLQLRPFRSLGISVFDAYWQFATLVLGLVLVGLLPRFSRRVADLGASDPVRTAGAGLAVVLVVPIALVLFGLSLFGIPLAVAGGAVYLVLWWVGAVYGRFTVGCWLLDAVPRALTAVDVDVGRVENRWVGLLVGTAAVGFFAVLPVVGPLVDSVVLLLGLGGVTRLAYDAYRRTERVERTTTATVAAGTGSDE